MRELVRLRARPSRDGKTFMYLLDYVDENGKRKRISLGTQTGGWPNGRGHIKSESSGLV